MLQKTAEKLFALLFFCCTVWLFRKLNGQQVAEKCAAEPSSGVAAICQESVAVTLCFFNP